MICRTSNQQKNVFSLQRQKLSATKADKSELKTTVKKFDAAVAEGNKDNAVAAFKAVTKKVDQVAARNIIHKNAAAHKKSQFAKKLASM